MNNRKNGFFGLPFALLGALLLGCLIGYSVDNRVMAQGDTFDELKVFTEVLSHIQNKYVEEVDVDQLMEGAVRGMIDTLDPHSNFMKKESYQDLKVDTKGEFGGLGIQIGVRDRRLVVISPIEDTPAFRAGIESGDHIVEVDGEPTKDMTISESVDMMRGPKGTDVVLTIIRDEDLANPLKITITRDIIKIKSVRSRMLEPGIGYIRVTQFQERSGSDLRDQLGELVSDGMEALVLDLRNNPGGLLTAAVEISEQFLEEGQMVVYIQGREGQRDEYYAHSSRRTNFPIVVLVNEGSASASEIVSGALQDLGRAVIMGTITFGKGSVQTILPLSDESGLRLTTAKYYTPSGRSIQNTGITPDIVVELRADQEISDERRQAFFREKDLEGHLANPNGSDNAIEPIGGHPVESTIGGEEDGGPKLTPEEESFLKDNQLQEAVDLLKGWRILKGGPGLVMTAQE